MNIHFVICQLLFHVLPHIPKYSSMAFVDNDLAMVPLLELGCQSIRNQPKMWEISYH